MTRQHSQDALLAIYKRLSLGNVASEPFDFFQESISATIDVMRKYRQDLYNHLDLRQLIRKIVSAADAVILTGQSDEDLRKLMQKLPFETRGEITSLYNTAMRLRKQHSNSVTQFSEVELSDALIKSCPGKELARLALKLLRTGQSYRPPKAKTLRRQSGRLNDKIYAPEPFGRGRPKQPMKMYFMALIAIDVELTFPDAKPARWRRDGQRGPFADLVEFCFSAAGLPGSDRWLRKYLAAPSRKPPTSH